MSGRVRDLRELVVTSRLESAQPLSHHTVPVQYGRKRTLKPLPPRGGEGSADAARRALKTPAQGFRLDKVLGCVDATFINGWLQRANTAVVDLRQWWSTGDNAMHFSHFWLSEFDEGKRGELLLMEHDLLEAEVQVAFRVGLDDGRIQAHDVARLLRAVFREYPSLFSEGDGTDFLDVIRVLSAGGDAYRALLSQIRCSTDNASFVEWLLAIRSFALVSFTCAIVGFFRQFDARQQQFGLSRPGTAQAARPPPTARRPQSSLRPLSQARQRPRSSRQPAAAAAPCEGVLGAGGRLPEIPRQGARKGSESARAPDSTSGGPTGAASGRGGLEASVEDVFKAVRAGLSDVAYYMLSRGIAPIDALDEHGRSLLFVAVLHRQVDVVQFLLENTDLFDVNARASSGNTPLHAAASAGDVELGQLLLMARAEPHPVNPQSGATPRLVADMQGHEDFVALIDRYTD